MKQLYLPTLILQKKLLEKTSLEDCRHSAIATINKVDVFIEKPVNQLGLNLQYQIRTISSEERQRFLQLEASAWKG